MPVICWDPFIIDIKCYRNMKKEEKSLSKYIVYNQGHFVLQDKIGNNIIFKKRSAKNELVKIKIDILLSSEMDMGDIVHMSIKRKMFSTSWNIINVKGYYSKYSNDYFNMGGQIHERIND